MPAFSLSWMIVLCISLLDCTSTFLQPVILCHAFGSVLLLRYASACFCTCFWKISYCICTHQHSSRLYKICEICVQAYLWALSPQASEYFYRIQNTDKNATVCLCCGSNKHFWLCTNSLIGQDCFFFFFLLFFAHSRKGAVAVNTLRWSHSTNNYS